MRLEIRKTGWVTVKKVAKDRLAKCEGEGLCCACLERIKEGQRPIRGMHPACYYATQYGIKTGKFTESERVKEGKMLPPGKPGRKPTNPVSLEAM